jgi:hypothetical protein
MVSTNRTSSTRDSLKDHFLNFNCYQFSRGITSARPPRRSVSAEQCLCTRDTPKICDRNQLYSLHFYELPDEEEAERQRELSENPDIPYDRIGVFRPDDGDAFIHVPPNFLDALWNAAIAADGVLRSIQLSVQPQKSGGWAVFEAYLKEEIAEPFPVDKSSRPKVGPPRAEPSLVELRAIRAQLRPTVWSVWLGVTIIAAGVLVALWIGNLWR